MIVLADDCDRFLTIDLSQSSAKTIIKLSFRYPLYFLPRVFSYWGRFIWGCFVTGALWFVGVLSQGVLLW